MESRFTTGCRFRRRILLSHIHPCVLPFILSPCSLSHSVSPVHFVFHSLSPCSLFSFSFFIFPRLTVGHINHKPRPKYWATRSSVRSHHSFLHPARCVHSVALFSHSFVREKVNDSMAILSVFFLFCTMVRVDLFTFLFDAQRVRRARRKTRPS